ncbi:alpha/beta hydrolase [Mesobacillus subterraneus]|uniref:intracellular short-chain-length polyhydroxyalkanoate depolymerase n=1 Tax=Mesobacillus subterraneus TaxID=285983 RepID=UPI001CFE64F5|nr:alpha/beta hydrolase [Mesobacillus subterraneus]WLR53916.1 alpha/beta hydrolase [Mesobacillus subterraneus]
MEKTAVELKKVDLQNGETISYRERDGGNKNVLLIHGNMTSSKHWDLLIDAIDPEYKIFAVDLRGFGESSYHKPIMSIKDFSDDVKMFVDEIGLKDFALVGWSTGGAVGMQFAADYPGYCEKLVLLASASTRGYPFFGTSEEGLPDSNNRLVTYEDVKADAGKTVAVQTAYDQQNRGFLKAMWNMLIYTDRQPEERHYDEYVDDMLTQRNLAEVYHSLNTFNLSAFSNGLKDGTDQVKDIQIPVLVLRGDRDFVVTGRMAEEIVEDFEGRARFVELKDCGHSPLVDDLDQLLQHVEGFLAE